MPPCCADAKATAFGAWSNRCPNLAWSNLRCLFRHNRSHRDCWSRCVSNCGRRTPSERVVVKPSRRDPTPGPEDKLSSYVPVWQSTDSHQPSCTFAATWKGEVSNSDCSRKDPILVVKFISQGNQSSDWYRKGNPLESNFEQRTSNSSIQQEAFSHGHMSAVAKPWRWAAGTEIRPDRIHMPTGVRQKHSQQFVTEGRSWYSIPKDGSRIWNPKQWCSHRCLSGVAWGSPQSLTAAWQVEP